MPYAITPGVVVVDPLVAFGLLWAVSVLVIYWDGTVWAVATAQRRRWTAALSTAAAFAWFYLPRGDFWWGW